MSRSISVSKYLAKCKFIRDTRGKLKIYEKSKGNFKTALKDFKKLGPKNIKVYRSKKGGIVREGQLKDGTIIKVRNISKDGRPTLEIRNATSKRGVEVRYGKKQ